MKDQSRFKCCHVNKFLLSNYKSNDNQYLMKNVPSDIHNDIMTIKLLSKQQYNLVINS